MLLLATVSDANSHRNDLTAVAEAHPEHYQRNRIIEALGSGSHIPRVDEEPLARYYKYLTARLLFPFTAHYPPPTTLLEEMEYRCSVVELLDPTQDICDEFDGIFCKTSKGKFETNLPLIELKWPTTVPTSS